MFYLHTGRYHKQHWDSAHLNCYMDETSQDHWTFYRRNGYKTDVLTYITDIRDRMKEAGEFIDESAREAQTRQNNYYDQKTREMDLKPGDKVLLLRPSSTAKFVAQWQGPYEVTR